MRNKALWQWTGLNAHGEVKHGLMWAGNRHQALLNLHQIAIIPVNIKRRQIKRSHWNTRYSSDIIQQLGTLLQAGLPLSQGLALLAEQHPSPQWQALLQDLAHQLEQGVSFSEALQQWPETFSALYIAMIKAGELTGKLEYCCFHLARQQKSQLQLAAKVKKAIRYPLMILALAAMVVVAMTGFVLPEFAAIYRTFNTPLPALTVAVMALSSLIQHTYWLMGVVILLPVFLKTRLRNNNRWLLWRAQCLLRMPAVGALIRGQRLSQIFTVLALTQGAGIPFLTALTSVIQTLTCPWWRSIIQKIHDDIASGSTIWLAFHQSAAFTPLCQQLIRTGETSGALDTMLDNLAQHHNESTHKKADDLASVLEPALLIVTGIIIGTLVVAMYLPVFHLGDAINGMG